METPRAGRGSPPDGASDPPPPDLSIVIPAYNEARRIGPSLERILAFVDARGLRSEIILVDDGSTDRTAEIARTHGGTRLRVLVNDGNRGKGYSVRRGILDARGKRVLFTDADLSAPIDELDKLLAALESGADIAIGSRAVDRSLIGIHQSPFREWGGIVYNRTLRWILGLALYDTQCGFKLFRREKAAPIFNDQTIEGFGFDPEILFLAAKRGLRIAEVPVRWNHEAGTTVRPWSDGPVMFLDLVRIRWNGLTGRYDGRTETPTMAPGPGRTAGRR